MPDESGHVWIVGAGPGNPGLLTVAGARALAEADVVVYDALAPAALLRGTKPDAELIFAGKRAGSHALRQDEIEALLVRHACQGKHVVRLKGGDPFVFGRGGEEALACKRAGVPFTVIPGVTSAIAALAYAGIPVTHRGLASGFLVVTATESEDGTSPDWAWAAKAETLIILMGVASLEDNLLSLLQAGKEPNTPAAVVRWGTRPDQQVVCATVRDLARRAREAGLSSPAVVVVGEVARLADELAWFDPGPLAGKRVVVTRARAQASELAAKLAALGAFVVEAPVVRVHPRRPDDEARAVIAARHDWWAFTSANAVDWAFAALAAEGRDARAFAGVQIAVIGDATAAALRSHGLAPDFMPSGATSACLGLELPLPEGARVLYPASALDDGSLAETLRMRGGVVTQLTAYDTLAETFDGQQLREVAEADAVTFASASTARFLRQALGETPLSPGVKLVSIGPQTSMTVGKEFGHVDGEAATPTLDALVEAVCEVLQ